MIYKQKAVQIIKSSSHILSTDDVFSASFFESKKLALSIVDNIFEKCGELSKFYWRAVRIELVKIKDFN